MAHRTAGKWFGAALLLGLVACDQTLLSENFEGYALGPLGSPWSVSSAGTESSVSVVSTGDHGKALLLHGGAVSPEFLTATLPLGSDKQNVVIDVSLKPDDGASFIWSFNGTSGLGYSPSARRIRLQREPGSNTLVASTAPSGNTNCGELASGVWSRVTLVIHADRPEHTFDVRINDADTACTGVATGLTTPFTGVSVMDASNDGWGGDVRFDDIRVTAL